MTLEFGKGLTAASTNIPGMLVLDLPVHGDSRGWFKENWQREGMRATGCNGQLGRAVRKLAEERGLLGFDYCDLDLSKLRTVGFFPRDWEEGLQGYLAIICDRYCLSFAITVLVVCGLSMMVKYAQLRDRYYSLIQEIALKE